MNRIEIGVKMERLAEILLRSPNRLEDIRDLCLELATDIDQYLQEVEEERFDEDYDEDEYAEEEYTEDDEDERYREYKYRYGNEEESNY